MPRKSKNRHHDLNLSIETPAAFNNGDVLINLQIQFTNLSTLSIVTEGTIDIFKSIIF